MSWEKVERTESKKLDAPSPQPMGAPLKQPKPAKPDKPSDPSKPSYPYSLSDSESKTHRWRWNSKTAGYMDQEELVEGVKYVLTILTEEGIEDLVAFVAEVAAQEQKTAQARLSYRQRIYGRK